MFAPTSATRRRVALGALRLATWGAAFSAFAAVRIAAIADRPPARFPDTASYLVLDLSHRGLRPWVVPLVYSLLSSDDARIAVQCAAAIVLWCALAYAVACTLRCWPLKVAGAGAVLLVGASPQVTRWDLALLSESLALSLTAAVIATWLMFAVKHTRGWGTAARVMTALWAFTREPHLALLPVILVLLALSLAWPNGRRTRALLLLTLVPICAWGAATMTHSSAMTDYNVYLLLQERVFPNHRRVEWFVRNGHMPTSKAILTSRGFVSRSDLSRQLLHQAEIPVGIDPPTVVERGGDVFVHWVHEHGAATYLDYLTHHPGFAFTRPWEDVDTMLAPRLHAISPHVRADPVLSEGVTAALFQNMDRYFDALVVGLMLTLVAWRRPRLGVSMVGLSVLASSGVLLYIAWHGAAIELSRHAIVASVASRIAIIILVVAGIDRILSRAAPRRRPPTAAPPPGADSTDEALPPIRWRDVDEPVPALTATG